MNNLNANRKRKRLVSKKIYDPLKKWKVTPRNNYFLQKFFFFCKVCKNDCL